MWILFPFRLQSRQCMSCLCLPVDQLLLLCDVMHTSVWNSSDTTSLHLWYPTIVGMIVITSRVLLTWWVGRWTRRWWRPAVKTWRGHEWRRTFPWRWVWWVGGRCRRNTATSTTLRHAMCSVGCLGEVASWRRIGRGFLPQTLEFWEDIRFRRSLACICVFHPFQVF